jgi:hypothetical protein
MWVAFLIFLIVFISISTSSSHARKLRKSAIIVMAIHGLHSTLDRYVLPNTLNGISVTDLESAVTFAAIFIGIFAGIGFGD